MNRVALGFRIRTGIDDQPYVYWRITGVGDELSTQDERGRPLTRERYRLLKPNQRGGITDDLKDWSPWQTYELDFGVAGTQILSPSPSSHIQVRIQFSSGALAGGQVDSLFFEYSQPPVVTSAVGEISPTDVIAASLTSFTYAVRARIEPGQTGFNAMRLQTSALVDSITDVRVDRGVVEHRIEPQDTLGQEYLIHFPRIVQDQSLLEIDFDARVFRYGTPFDGALLDTSTDDVPLAISAGDAVPGTLSDELVVRTSLTGDIIADLSVQPNPFSPNGDGINDRLKLTSAVLRLTGQTQIDVQIFDLAGRLIRQLEDVVNGSSPFSVEWDGTDGAGNLSPPGLYVFRLVLDADPGTESRVGQVALVY